MLCRATMSRNTRVSSRKMRNEINKTNYKNYKNYTNYTNYTNSVENREYKIQALKKHFVGYPGKYQHKWSDVISNLETHESFIDDLYDMTMVYQYSATGRKFVRDTINKHIDEFQNDQDILEFFAYILYTYKSI